MTAKRATAAAKSGAKRAKPATASRKGATKQAKAETPSKFANAPVGDDFPPMVRAFIDRYAVHRIGKRAAIEAGYSADSAESQASRLLRNAKVREAVDNLIASATTAAGVDVQDVLREVGRLAFVDIRRLFNDDGSLKNVHELDDDTAAAIASVEVQSLFAGSGKERTEIGYTTKVKLFDKNSAAEKLMRHLGLFKADNRQKTDALAQLLALVAERGQRLPIRE